MQTYDPAAGSAIICGIRADAGCAAELPALVAEPTNRDIEGEPCESRTWWVLIAQVVGGPYGEPFVWVAPDRETLDRLARARGFRHYHLKEVEAGVVPPLEGNARDLSVCYLRDRLPAVSRLVRDMVDCGYLTLGDLVDAGPDRLHRWGLSVRMIQQLRRKLARIGLRIGPLARRTVA